MIFLDNNSTTKPLSEVCYAVNEGLVNCWGNPSSMHAKGLEASSSIEEARERIANFIGVNLDDITFTSGSTEANEAVLRHYFTAGYNLVSSIAEHPAITGFYQKYAPERVHHIPNIKGSGEWSLETLENVLKSTGGGGVKDLS